MSSKQRLTLMFDNHIRPHGKYERSKRRARFATIYASLLLLHLPLASNAETSGSKDLKCTLTTKEGTERSYVLHVPASGVQQRLPLVILLHGGGGGAGSSEKVEKLARISGFNEIADREKFIVVYPLANGRHWYDGRPDIPKNNDAEFIDQLISHLVATTKADSKHIYAAGVSNGGFFANYLGLKLSGKLAGIAGISGPIALPNKQLVPPHPVSVLLIAGTDDPIVPFTGGGINEGASGQTLSHDASVARWKKLNSGATTVHSEKILGSRSQSQLRVWNTVTGALVGSLVTRNGRHGWNLGLDDKTRGFDTAETIWTFFEQSAPVKRD